MRIEAVVVSEDIQRDDNEVHFVGVLPNPYHARAPVDLEQLILSVVVADIPSDESLRLELGLSYAGRSVKLADRTESVRAGRATLAHGMKRVPVRVTGEYRFQVA